MKSLDQNIPQALAVLISCAMMLYRVLTKVQKPPLGCRSFPRHREASLHTGGTVFLREQLPSDHRQRWMCLGLSFPSEVGWLGHPIALGGRTSTGFSPGRMCVMTHGYQVFPAEAEERKRPWLHWGCWGSLLQISGSRRASCEGKVGPAIINWW